MFEKILLPLDGSELAESALPYVRDLVGKLNAEAYLVHFCPPGHQTLNHMHRIYLEATTKNLREEIKKTWDLSEPKLYSEVVADEPVKGILDYIQKKSMNLVALTTYGASGIRIWALGSVADKVVREAGIPTLLVRVKEKQSISTEKRLIEKILVPLDSSEASRITVPYAVDLAKKLGASITLFSMAETVYVQNLDVTGSGLGINWDQVDAATMKYIEEYLSKIEGDIREAGVNVNHINILGIDAASEILELEKKLPADLVIMATRGRSPIVRWAFGSTAEKVLREGGLPLLLIRERLQIA
jgi:nucleotide-binding universal stress UspA family protein